MQSRDVVDLCRWLFSWACKYKARLFPRTIMLQDTAVNHVSLFWSGWKCAVKFMIFGQQTPTLAVRIGTRYNRFITQNSYTAYSNIWHCFASHSSVMALLTYNKKRTKPGVWRDVWKSKILSRKRPFVLVSVFNSNVYPMFRSAHYPEILLNVKQEHLFKQCGRAD